MNEITQILTSLERDDPKAAEQILPLVYDELRRLAANKLRSETPNQTLQATALVHEAYLRLVARDPSQPWNGRGHFFAAAAEAMRRILVERARYKKSQKGGGELRRRELDSTAAASAGLDFDLLDLNDALERLETHDRRKAELVKLRYFAGMTIAEAAELLGISTSTAENDWAYARCWLRLALDPTDSDR